MPSLLYPIRLVAAAVLLAAPASLSAQEAPQSAALPAEPAPTDTADYVRLARWGEGAPMVADVTVRKAILLDRKEQAGGRRTYIEADTNALIRGNEAIADKVVFIANLPSGGSLKALSKQRLLVFARPVAGKPSELQLIAPDAFMTWSAQRDASVRGLIKDMLAPGAPPAIAAVTSAFHVPGTITGEGETQIFLKTANGRPASLYVRRDASESTQWGAAFGEVVDQSATHPAPLSLGWYRLACGLPQSLPASAFNDAHADHRMEVERDYRFILDRLGPCPA